MEFTLIELISAFLYSLVIGFFMGLLYEPVRIIHKLGLNGELSYFISDAVFMTLCGLITFYYSLAMLEGRIRGFVILGEIAGFFVFRYTLKPILDIIYTPIIKLFKKIFKNLLKISRKVMYNTKIKVKKFVSSILNKVSKYEKRRKEKRKDHRRKAKRYKRSKASKEKKK